MGRAIGSDLVRKEPAPAVLPRTPRQVWEQMLRHHLDRDIDGFADLFAIDGVMELPFGTTFEGVPCRMEGREEIRRTLAPLWRRAAKARRVVGYEPTAIHETRDPEVVIVEFDVHGEVEGKHHRLPYVHILRVRGGLIVSLRDYFDSAQLAARIQEDARAAVAKGLQ